MTQETSPQSTAHPKRYINLILCVCMFVPLSPYFAQIFPKGSVIMCFHGRVHKVARFVCFPGLAIFWFFFFKNQFILVLFSKIPPKSVAKHYGTYELPVCVCLFFKKNRGARGRAIFLVKKFGTFCSFPQKPGPESFIFNNIITMSSNPSETLLCVYYKKAATKKK